MDAKLRGAAPLHSLGGRETLHRNLDKLEGSHQLHEISKEQVLDSAPRLGNYICMHRLGYKGLESSPVERDLGSG